jgi:hypothetical protein
VDEILKLVLSSSKNFKELADTAVISINCKEIMSMHQREESLVEYYNRFNDAIDRLETMYGDFYPTVMVTANKRTKMSQEMKIEEANEKFNTQPYIQSCHRAFKQLLRDLEKNFSLGQGGYPTNRGEALHLMSEYEKQLTSLAVMKRARKKHEEATEEVNIPGLAFVMTKRRFVFSVWKGWTQSK